MPGAIKKRKVSATIAKNATTAGTRNLDAYTRVSKASVYDKAVIEKNNYVDTVAIASNITTGGKRKLVEVKEEVAQAVSTITTAARDIKPLPRRHTGLSPQTPEKQTNVSPVLETPTKGARSLLNRLFVSTKETDKPTREASPLPAQLPTELLDLINLHASFLTALSLHYAHNGTHSPADLRMLCPDVARAWGKRRVVLDDIRRTLGIMNEGFSEEIHNQKLSKLSLSDYGHGKICIEITTGGGKKGRVARPVDENSLNDMFVQELWKIWEGNDSDATINEFIDGLPLEPITTCASLSKMSPLLAKGQRRLEDLKAGIVIKKDIAKGKDVLAAEIVTGTKPTLLERLRAKQLHQSTLPAPPSKEQLSRKAALQRIGEVAGVLTMLSTSSSIGQQRISFTMPTVLAKLRDSLKTPMSKEEGDVCLRLLVTEIAPNWVKLVKMGKMEALVVDRDHRPSESDIKDRIKHAV
ncbi:hypothetical protein B0O99DRAFT_593631 [Bisporella sp. PMI_857]|nr:hypothetical protein B0O99DRAFT_593631 [Bisporella sp. PMI_857]